MRCTFEALIELVTPEATVSVAISPEEHLLNGTPRVAGSSQAMAVTWATTVEANTGLLERSRSDRPDIPSCQKRYARSRPYSQRGRAWRRW